MVIRVQCLWCKRKLLGNRVKFCCEQCRLDSEDYHSWEQSRIENGRWVYGR